MIGTIEQKIIDCIKSAAAAGVLGYEIDKIGSYKGEFNFIREFVGNCRTAVLVAFGGKNLKRNLGGALEYEATFYVEVYSRTSTRNESENRSGKAGAYQIAEDIEVLLNGQNLGILTESLELQHMEPVLVSEISSYHVGALELEFKCSFQSCIGNEDEFGRLNPFEVLSTNWDLPEPFDQTMINLPQPPKEQNDE